jgi:hypothetical protein
MPDSLEIIYPPIQEAAPNAVQPVLQAASRVIGKSKLGKNAGRQQDLFILEFKFAHLGISKTGDLECSAISI